MKDHIEDLISEYQSLIDSGESKKAIEKGYEVEETIQRELFFDKKRRMTFYLSLGFLLFEEGKYSEFLRLVSLSQKYGRIEEDIVSSIEQVFMRPNETSFREIYDHNISKLKLTNQHFDFPDFEDLQFSLLPTENEDEFYVFNKKSRIIEQIENYRMTFSEDEFVEENEFADYVIYDKSWKILWEYMHDKNIENKKFYVILNSFQKVISLLQGKKIEPSQLNRLIFFCNLEELKHYLQHHNAYLPWNILSYRNDKILIENILIKLHQERITLIPQDKSKVLLSICIPSFNRGDIAQKHLLEMLETKFDNEIEFILSNNGTKNETRKKYTEISNMKDTRFLYHEFDKNMGVSINCCKVCQLSNGRFMMLLSDEDTLHLENIDKILKIIKEQGSTLATIKTVHLISGILETGFANKGIESYCKYAFQSNYLSVNIFNNDLLKIHNIVEYTLNNMDNPVCFYYPHMSWDLLIMQYGDVLSTSILLVNEGEEKSTDIGEKVLVDNQSQSIPWYQTIEGRLEQHEGNLRIVEDLELIRNDMEALKTIFIQLCAKTFYLLGVSAYYCYGKKFLEKNLEVGYDYCKKSLREFYECHLIGTGEDEYKKMENKLQKFYDLALAHFRKA